ncbi:translation initiation factor [Sulfurimonas sp. C5]|uniref:translation initiation factor n=1 Tax=Sulfurimonas sp. C5 TaxID=3036947 RepID=UPI0024569C1C|nr:translation initiation factor [Sulfurimonas sp. C5]MDH4944958.1 translation initiation factor [Sulfurimonas sp. C5]
MSRGKKLDLFIGANIEDGWNEIEEKKNTSKKTVLSLNKHQLFFSKEKRRGKVVTLVGEFQLEKNNAEELLKKLKKKLGCGGSFKDGFMEFQGELKEKLRPLLVDEGFNFKAKH